MMKFSLLVCCLLLASCGNSFKKVSDYPSIPLTLEEMPIDPMMWRPYKISILDSTLIMIDRIIDGKYLLLYNLADGSYVRTLSDGQGPGELIGPLAMDVSFEDKSIAVLQRPSGICRLYTLDQLQKDSTSVYEEVKMPSSDRMARLPDGYVAGGYQEGGILAFYDRSGQQTGNLDICPEWITDGGQYAGKYKALQGYPIVSPVNGCLMFAPTYASKIRFYQRQDGQWSEVNAFPLADGSFERRVSEGSHVEIVRGDDYHCLEVCQSERYFYVLHVGADFFTWMHTSPLERRANGEHYHILRFTLGGNLDNVYEVDPTINTFCVSQDDSVLYAVFLGKDGEYAIGRARL